MIDYRGSEFVTSMSKRPRMATFGAAGSIVVVLLWSYWSAQMFFLGLEFTHVYAQERST